jgi:hypothetical protein
VSARVIDLAERRRVATERRVAKAHRRLALAAYLKASYARSIVELRTYAATEGLDPERARAASEFADDLERDFLSSINRFREAALELRAAQDRLEAIGS